ncbi:PAS domain S-box protein [Cytobacillus sp. Hm23]
MEYIVDSFNPFLILLSIILTILATYTAIDLLLIYKKAEKNKRRIFISGSISMAIGIWIVNFLGILASAPQGIKIFHIPLATFSFILALLFTATSFSLVTKKSTKFIHIFICSLVMTIGLVTSHIIGISAVSDVVYNILLVALSSMIVLGTFVFSFWILFQLPTQSATIRTWITPICSFLITCAIVQNHFILIRASNLQFHSGDGLVQSGNQDVTALFVVLVFSIMIFSGLLANSISLNRRVASKETYAKDITTALDESSIVAITDAKGSITYVNDKFVQISKYEEHELIGQNHRILNSNYHSSTFFRELWQTIGHGDVWKGQIRNRAKDGTHYWVDTTIVPLLNSKGKPYQYVSIRNDITSKKLTELQLKDKLKEISDIKYALDQSTIVAITDRQGFITYANDEFCKISKYDREELLGKNHSLLNSGYHSTDFFKNMWKTIGNGDIWKGEIHNKAKDGSFYWVYTTIVPFVNEDGKPYQYLAIRNDITDQKKTEEMLHRQDKLAAVGQLAAGVAHEIRNPLTSMKGYAEFLREDENNIERQEFLDIILDEIERVNSIVEDFMVLAKPNAPLLKVKDIIPMINNVLSLLEFEAKKRKVKLKFEYNEEEIKVACDENRLKQVFLNFIKNGIEAMPNGGDLIVRAVILDEHVQITIHDTGVGIPEEKMKKLGEPFYTTKKDGNGLGLMVSFKIIESHYGKVFIESEENKGTTFNILLPKTA